jgi:integrase
MKHPVRIPDKDGYRFTLARLIDEKEFKTLLALRMGCEMGLSRLEIVNERISDLDRFHQRGLWVEIAKKVRRGYKYIGKKKRIPVFEMRQREIPVNSNLYAIMQSFIRKDQVYLLYREKGDVNKPFAPEYLNKLYKDNNVVWATHGSRHFFKNCVMDWMREVRQVDEGLLAELLGHKKSQTQQYGSISWDYKREVLDKVFE